MNRQRDAMFAIVGLVSRIFREERRHIRQRTDARYVYYAAVTLGTCGADTEFIPVCPAWALDLSYQGVGLVAEREFAVGERLHMKFTEESGEEQIVGTKVVVAAQVLPRLYRLGLIFEFEESGVTVAATAHGDVKHK